MDGKDAIIDKIVKDAESKAEELILGAKEFAEEKKKAAEFWAKEYVAQNATYNMVKAIFQDEDIFYWIENNTDYLVKPNATRLDYTIEIKEA